MVTHQEYEKIPDLFPYQSLIPPSFNGIFTMNYEISNADIIYIPRCHSAFVCKLPLYFLPAFWNDWVKI
jgi:hypothetical protein